MNGDSASRVASAVLLPLVFSAMGSSASAQDYSVTEREVAGCYHLDLSPWSRPLDPADSSSQQPPERVELQHELGSEIFENGKLMLRPTTTGHRPQRAWSWWEVISADSVRLVWTTGFAGSEARLLIEGDSLMGEIRTFVDFHNDNAKAALIARPVPCEGHFR